MMRGEIQKQQIAKSKNAIYGSKKAASPSPSASFHRRLFLHLPLFLFPFLSSILAQQQSSPPAGAASGEMPRRNEMLVPLNSTSALICEPVFNQGHFASGDDGIAKMEARWMRDGHEVARITDHSNAVLGAERTSPPLSALSSRTTTMEPIPQIGFLVIANMRAEDEGEYWCERLPDGQQGERTRLRVAFLTPYAEGQKPRVVAGSGGSHRAPRGGQMVVLECPQASGVPPPVINWLFNGERIDFASLNMQMAPNSSLLIHNFSANQSGFFSCEAATFAGRSVSAELFLPEPTRRTSPRGEYGGVGASSSLLVECLSAYVRNGVLWFLIGCLTTSCVVLAYILGALFLYRLYSLRDRHRWRRTLVSAPGFRKVVAPMADGAPPPPYFDSGGASEV